MFDLDKWTEIGHVLSRNKVRTFITGLGVFSGTLILVVLLGTSNGLERGVLGGFLGVVGNSVVISNGTTSMAWHGYQPGRRVRTKQEDAALLERTVPGVNRAYPRCMDFFKSVNVTRNGIAEGFRVQGDLPDFYHTYPIYTTTGRFLNMDDVRQKRKVAVIGKRVYEVLFDDGEDAAGQYISIGEVYFQVVGVTETKNSGMGASFDEETVYIPIATYQDIFNMGDNVSFLFVNVRDEYDSEKVLEQSLRVLRKKHDVHPDDQLSFGFQDFGTEFKKISGLFAGVSILMWVVGTGTLIAGVVGVSNIMLIVVKERTREFGVRRALGASPRNILSQVIMESVTLTFLSGAMGFMAGVGVVQSGLLESFFVSNESETVMFADPTVDFIPALVSIVFIVFFGALGGLIPAKKAAGIKPVEALNEL